MRILPASRPHSGQKQPKGRRVSDMLCLNIFSQAPPQLKKNVCFWGAFCRPGDIFSAKMKVKTRYIGNPTTNAMESPCNGRRVIFGPWFR